jgi:hypothetical protein
VGVEVHVDAGQRDARHGVLRVVAEGRLAALVLERQRDPRLYPVQLRTRGPQVVGAALRVRDAAARGHPVHRARLYALHGAEAVAVHERAFEEIGHGREPDVRMRPHVHAAARRELRRPHVIEEDERPDHLVRMAGQQAAY